MRSRACSTSRSSSPEQTCASASRRSCASSPRIGDAAASALSCHLLYGAHRLGVPTRIFARMLFNVAVEGIVGMPIAGDAFDVAFRANRRNVRLLRDCFDGRS